jgi:hypothetical protein
VTALRQLEEQRPFLVRRSVRPGSGNSTSMNIVGCLDAPPAGRYLLDTDVRRFVVMRDALNRPSAPPALPPKPPAVVGGGGPDTGQVIAQSCAAYGQGPR